MRGQVVVIGAVVLALGVLGYRNYALERRLDALGQQLGAASEAAAELPAKQPGHDNPDLRSHAARLSTLEQDLRALRAEMRALKQATAAGNQPVSDQQIVSVMQQQGAKLVDAQLKFYRERWLDQREQQLNDFSRAFGLSQQQNDQVWELLSDETDKMVELLRRQDLTEDPARGATLLKAALLDTDASVHRVLDARQASAWDQGRQFERKVLWPWLPE